MLNKKMLLSVLIIGCIVTIASGTYAYFSDQIIAADNNVTAGTLQLNDNIATQSMKISNAEPGDNEKTVGNILVKNTGSLDGIVNATISDVTGSEMKPYMLIYITDANGNKHELYNRGTEAAPVTLGTMNHGASFRPVITYTFVDDGTNQNSAQGKTFSFNIKFDLKQN